ncbi:MAG TPA: hypothetical protein VM283_04540 [Armatimonadota bacterium]|nr:hypothetical protein [Armatimonadota bacterium]
MSRLMDVRRNIPPERRRCWDCVWGEGSLALRRAWCHNGAAVRRPGQTVIATEATRCAHWEVQPDE